MIDLKYLAPRIIRAVREEQAQYVVTVAGRPVAVLRPYTAEDEADQRAASGGASVSVGTDGASDAWAASGRGTLGGLGRAPGLAERLDRRV